MTRSVHTAVFAAALASSVAFAALAAPALAQPATAAKPAQEDVVVATVNGTPIRASELAIAVEDIGPGLPPQLQGPEREAYVLSFLTDMTLLAQEAEAEKLAEGPEFKKRMAYARNKALMEMLLNRAAEQAVTEEAKRKTYDEFVKSAPAEEEVRARHILVEDEAKAKELAKRARAGEDFAKLADENSRDSGGQGGDLGYFTKELMVPEFANAAFKLEKGQISDPVKSQFGWHVIKLEDKRTKAAPTYQEVEPQVEQYLVRKSQADLVTRLREAGKVEKAGAPADKADAAQPAAETPAKDK
ncbi:peptidylprolyl isomerase [Xanthobacter sp. TB0139]|uniref:peptidylprolyl isomerase n=1 Tax=Xanthobacter sp. TB0139 TaxID=3459178 RepID=UPI00403909A9